MQPDTALMKAIRRKNEEDALHLIESSNLSFISYDDKTPLMLACISGLEEVAHELVKHDCNIEYVDSEGNTALIYSCMSEMEEVALAILDKCNDYNHTNSNNESALNICCGSFDMMQVIEELLKKEDIDINKPNDEENTPLMTAIMNDNEDVAHKLLDTLKCDLSYINSIDESAFGLACEMGLEEVALKIWDLSRGECHPCEKSEDDTTPFMNVVINNMSELAQKMIDKGKQGDLSITDEFGNTSLVYAITNGMEDIAIKLLDLPGVDKDFIDSESNSVLYHAIRLDLENLIKRFITLGTNLRYSNDKGESILSLLCEKNKDSIIQEVIEKLSYDYSVPILLKYQKFGVVKSLIEKSNDPGIKLFIKELLNIEELVDLIKLIEQDVVENVANMISDKDLATECVICLRGTYLNFVLFPCHHVLHCDFDCLGKIKTCPVCRSTVEHHEQVYLT